MYYILQIIVICVLTSFVLVGILGGLYSIGCLFLMICRDIVEKKMEIMIAREKMKDHE